MPGHPCSTGLSEIDYFISSELMESVHARNHYSEQLIKFQKMPTSMKYIKPDDTEQPVIKLESGKIWIGIIHTLFKLTPGFDNLLEQILDIDANIQFVVFESPSNLGERIKARWQERSKNLISRSRFIPMLKYDDFLRFICQLDIVLDPFAFGAGTVFYQCMACGVPLITKPSRLLKTRVASGGYKQMKLSEPPVASNDQEYIEICRRLVKSKEARENLSNEIKERASTFLYNHNETLIEYESFVKDAVLYNRKGKKLPEDWKVNLSCF